MIHYWKSTLPQPKRIPKKDIRRPSEMFDGWGHCFHACGRPKWLIPREY